MSRENLIMFTKGVLDKIRDYCGIPNECDDIIKIDDFNYEKVIPSFKDGLLKFKIRPHGRLFYLQNKKDHFMGFVKNENEVKELINLFVRQL